jgi:DNA-binding Lrp family transcriptional regulator
VISMKDIELRLVAELMKNSRRSDRELAKAIGISQPTVSRTIRKLEKEGIIREYTMIPDFSQLGYGIMATMLMKMEEPFNEEKLEKIYEATAKLEKTSPYSALIAVNCVGKEKNRVVIAFYKSYSDYAEAMKITKQLPFADIGSIESYLTDLNDKTNYRVLSLSAIARELLQRSKKTENHE